MDPSGPRPYGLRFTLRHQMILIVYLGFVLAVFHGVGSESGAEGVTRTLSAVVLASPWVLALLVLALDRKGPLKNWAALVLLMLFSPALALNHDGIIALDWRRSGTVPDMRKALSLNLFFLGSFSFFWSQMSPARCPSCDRRALIPLIGPWGQNRRNTRTRWCAACGERYWKFRKGTWQKERRMTW